MNKENADAILNPMPRKFVRYKEGTAMYGMGISKFQELAKEAHATYKIKQLVLVNIEILAEYLELFRVY